MNRIKRWDKLFYENMTFKNLNFKYELHHQEIKSYDPANHVEIIY